MAVTGLTLCMANRQAASAGGINSNEQGVLDAAGAIFYYGGEAYAAADIYLQQLRQELMEDDVDLTAKEADKYITKIYGSIKEGIDEGYLVKVKVSPAAGGGSETESPEAATGDNRTPSDGKTGEGENTEQAEPAAETAESGQRQEDEKETEGRGSKKENERKEDSGSGTENANQEPDDGMDTASAGGKNVPDGEAVTQDESSTDENAAEFSFLDADASEAGGIRGEAATEGALAGEGAAAGDAAAKDTLHTYRDFFADVLMLILAAAAAGSAYLLYKKKGHHKRGAGK